MPVHLEEFLYRGRPEGSAEPPAWHVTLLAVSEDEFGDRSLKSKTLNMQQAEAAGWPLPDVLEAINADVLQEAELLRVAAVERGAEIERLKADNDTLRAALDAATSRLAALAAEAPVEG